MFTKCWHIGISVSDMERSVAFYRDVLGFEVLDTGEAFDEEDELLDLKGTHLLATSMQSGDVQLELLQFVSPPGKTRAPGMNDAGCVHMALASDEDVFTLRERLLAAGVDVTSEPYKDQNFEGLYCLFFKDPDGTMIEVMQKPS
jgi:catechol 2,3-dioxygenase-like lactoylglutathione lyase family enzyme